MTISLIVTGSEPGYIQGSSISSFQYYGSNNGFFPSISGDKSYSIFSNNKKNITADVPFNESELVNDNAVDIIPRKMVPNFSIDLKQLGTVEKTNLDSTYKDADKFNPAFLKSGIKNRYQNSDSSFREQLNGIVDVFGRDTSIIKFTTSSLGKSTTMAGGINHFANSHFPGGVLITDIIKLKEQPSRPYIDGPISHLGILAQTTGTFANGDINISPFLEQSEKQIIYKDFTDTALIASFPDFISGSQGLKLGYNEKYSISGFVYDNNEKGTDSVVYGGLKK